MAPSWRRLFWPGLMRDADRLIEAHGREAYGMAQVGVRANRENERYGHWSGVASEIRRRNGPDARLWSRCL